MTAGTSKKRTSAQVRDEVGHPIIDADGHMLELVDAAHPFIRESLGPRLFDEWRARGTVIARAQAPMSLEQRQRTRTPQGAWWGTHTVNVVDRATATLPALLYERMPELGIDFTILYPTNSLLTPAEEDEDLRRGLCAGYNAFYADIYGSYADRIAPAGIVPMHTPAEAVAELHHMKSLGIKVACFPEGVLRPLTEAAGDNPSPWLFAGQRQWFDCFGLDSMYDYDPVWQACRELGFAVTFHGGLNVRPGVHWSITSYVANHVGQFMAEMYPLVKSLIFGGVTRRFADLPFVFLECGVSWAVQMVGDIIEHWERRNLEALEMYNPARLDKAQLGAYFKQYGGRLAELLGGDPYDYVQGLPIHGRVPDQPDEFIHMDLRGEDDIVAQFDQLYFGCEADDRGIATAFAPWNAQGSVLKPVLGSDMGHWDVTDIATVIASSYELVDAGHLSAEQFRAVAYDNPRRMFEKPTPVSSPAPPSNNRSGVVW